MQHGGGVVVRAAALGACSMWLAGCASSAPSVGAASRSPATEAPPPVAVPAPPLATKAPPPVAFTVSTRGPLVPTRSVCATEPASGTSAATSTGLVSYDYDAVVVRPVDFGPLAGQRAHAGSRRSLGDVRNAMHRWAGYFSACYRWARHEPRQVRRGAFEPTFDVILVVDAFGQVGQATIKNDRGATGLAQCVRAGLLNMRLRRRTPRTTRIEGTIEFRLSGQPRPRKRPARPTPRARESIGARACVRAQRPMPVDVLRGVIGAFDDYDAAVAARSYARKHRGLRPRIRIACASVTDDLDKRWMAPYLRSNLGAVRRCYRAALGRQKGLTGTVVSTFDTDRGGQLRNIKVTGAGDAALHACIARAWQDTVLPSTSRRLQFRIPFALRSGIPEVVLPKARRDRADALLRAGDGLRAVVIYADLIRASGHGPDECHGRLGVLRAMMVVAPWLRDPRVDRAARQLVGYLAGASATRATATCRAQAASTLTKVATWPLHEGARGAFPLRYNAGLADVAARVRALLAAWPAHPQHVALTDLLARAETAAGEDQRALRTWVELLGKGPLTAARVRRAIRGYSKVRQRADQLPVMRTGSCPAVRRFH